MEFFNKKEDVMDIVMTRKGREHYASGTFDPTYYAFYDDEVIYDIQYVTGSNQTLDAAAEATFEGLAALNADDDTELILVNADTSTVTFTTDSSKDETESTALLIGTDLSEPTTAIATKSLHVAFTAAIAAGTLKMTLDPVTYTNETIITLGQQGDGRPGGAGGLTTITVPANISAQAGGSGVNGAFTRTATTYSGGEQQEVQNAIGRRIRDSITLKNQTGWYEARTAKTQQKVKEPFFRVLGKSSRLTSSAPAWEVNVVDSRGALSGSIKYIPLEFSGSGKGNKKSPYTDVILTDQQAIRKYNKEKIPQLNIFCDYDVRIIDTLDWLATAAEREKRTALLDASDASVKCSDDGDCHGSVSLSMKSGQYLKELREKYGGEISLMLKKSTDDFLLDFVENNVEDTDFTLEVYEYIYDKDNNVREIKQLNFSDEEHGPDFVEYYFDLTTDKETEIDLNIKYIQESLEVEEEPSPCPPGSTPLGTAPTTGPAGTTPDGYSCKKDSDCKAGSKCANGTCAGPARVHQAYSVMDQPGFAAACKDDSDCPNKEFPACQGGKCLPGLTQQEIKGYDAGCKKDSDCAGDLACRAPGDTTEGCATGAAKCKCVAVG